MIGFYIILSYLISLGITPFFEYLTIDASQSAVESIGTESADSATVGEVFVYFCLIVITIAPTIAKSKIMDVIINHKG